MPRDTSRLDMSVDFKPVNIAVLTISTHAPLMMIALETCLLNALPRMAMFWPAG